jgi:hypothetical protein
MNLLDILRQFAAQNTDPAGSPERIEALRAHLSAYRTDNADAEVDLTALDTASMEAFEALANSGQLSPQALADMQIFADICDAARALAGEDEQASQALSAEAEALRARVSGGQPEQDTDDQGDDTEGGEGDTPPEPVVEPDPAPAGEPALVAGARRRPSVPLNSLPNHPRRTGPNGSGNYQWRAAAEIRGISAGSAIETSGQLVRAAITRMQSFGRSGAQGTHQAGIAVIDRSTKNGTFAVDGTDVEQTMLDKLTDEKRLPGGSLVAAGGWCAPSEILYDLLPGADANEGILDLPTVTARRGGIRWPATPQFSAIYGQATASFYQTEATVIAGVTPKPCYEIPCTSNQEIRLGVVGLCIRSPILTERGYPELVETTTAEILAAHAHKVNQRKIADVVTGATAVTMAAADVSFAGYTATLLSAIELQVQYLRYRHRWSQSVTLEAVLPLWARGSVRADIAGRNGQPIDTVTDAQVDAWFAARGVRVQYVYDWQDSYATGNAADFGGTTPPKRYPTTVTMLIYRAGTYFVAESDVITVDGLYDSTLLAANMHLAYFTEEGYALGKRDWPSIALTVPVFPGGYTGAQLDPPALNLIPDPA